MNEIKRPASVRELIDHLPRATLVYLCELRGLAVSRANDDCRSSISRSFRGQRDDLLHALRKDDLVTLLRVPIRHRNALFELPNPHTYSKSELTTLAVRAFGRLDELLHPFVERNPKGAAAGAPAAARSPAAAPPPPEPPSDVAPPSVGGRGWSRLQPIASLFAKLGREAPSELGQEAFGQLVEELELRGFEVADASGATLTPLHDALAIDAEVRIRHDAHAGPIALDLGRGRTEHPPAAVPELSDYARASLRLELLTCSLDVEPSEESVSTAIDLATAGAAIEAGPRALLVSVARSLAAVRRSAFSVLTSLQGRLDQDDVEILLRDLGALERDPRVAYQLGEHWAALHGRVDAPESQVVPVSGVSDVVQPVLLTMMKEAELEDPLFAAALAANWGQLPDHLSVYELERFSRIVDGYEVSEQHLGRHAFDVRAELAERRGTGELSGTAVELVVGLFAEVRGWRGLDTGPEDGDRNHLGALEMYAALLRRLRARPREVRFVPSPVLA